MSMRIASRAAGRSRPVVLRSRSRRLVVESLEARQMLAGDLTGVITIGGATIFSDLPPTTLPPVAGGPALPYLTPADQRVLLNKLNTPSTTNFSNTPPAILPGSPASRKPVPSSDSWTGMMTRDPRFNQLLLNRDAYDNSGTVAVPYNGAYPNATFVGPLVDENTGKLTGNTGVVAQFNNQSGNPNMLGPMGFGTRQTSNPKIDTTNNKFGAPNLPFATTPTQIFAVQSTARFLDYRPGRGNPNGEATVINPVTGQPVGLLPSYQYRRTLDAAATNWYGVDNLLDLGITAMDLSARNADGTYIDPVGVDSNNLLLTDYSDYAASFQWSNSAGTLNVTMASGSPFAQFTVDPGTARDGGQNQLVVWNGNIAGYDRVPNTGRFDAASNALIVTGLSPIANTTVDPTAMDVVTDPRVRAKSFYAIYFPSGTSITYENFNDGSNPLLEQTPKQVPLFGQGANYFAINLPPRANYTGGDIPFVVATLPDDDPGTVAAFRQYAFNYVTDTRGDFTFDPTSNQVKLNLAITTRNMDAASAGQGALLAVYPHQYKYLPSSYDASYLRKTPNDPASTYTLPGIFGLTRLLAPPESTNPDGTNTVTVAYALPFQGTLPLLPMGAFVSTDPNDQPIASPAEVAAMKGLVTSIFTNVSFLDLLRGGLGNTYIWGKYLTRLANLVPIADQLGLVRERDDLLALLKSSFTSWFTAREELSAAPGQVLGYDPTFGVEQFLYLDQQFDAIIGYDAGFGTDTGLNDLHYTWGYWVKAAAVVALYDPTFVDGYGDLINLLIKNVNNWDRTDTNFPYLRLFNPYDSHGWASGVVPVGDGNNEESASEAINGYSAMVDWGQLLMAYAPTQGPSDPRWATGKAIRDLGAALTTFQINAYEQYWMNVDGDTFPELTLVQYDTAVYAAGGYLQRYSYADVAGNVRDISQWKNEIYASNQFALQRGTKLFALNATTAEGNNAEAHYNIAILPITPGSLYLGRRVDYQTRPADGSASTLRNVPAENYARYVADQNVMYGPPPSDPNLGNRQPRNIPNKFSGNIWAYQALFDAQSALDRWNGIGGYRLNYPATADPTLLAKDNYTNYGFDEEGESTAMTYFWLQTLRKYGQVNGAVWANNAPASAVLDLPNAVTGPFTRTYIVTNVAQTSLSGVTFTDGFNFPTAPGRSVLAVTVTRDTLNGPITKTVTNTYTLPKPALVPANPSLPGTTDLFLGFNPNAPAPTKADGTIFPLSVTPPASPGLAELRALDPTGPLNSPNYFYPYGTSYVFNFTTQPGSFPAGALLTNVAAFTFQIQNVNGTYNPQAITDFLLQFKFPNGQVGFQNNSPPPVNLPGTDYEVAAQVKYELNDADNTVITETYGLTLNLSGKGGVALYTPRTLSIPPLGTNVPNTPYWSGVIAATRTVGQPQDFPDSIGFQRFNSSDPKNVNLLNPWDAQNATSPSQLLGRSVQWQATPFQMTGGTITLIVYVAGFRKNSTDFTDPRFQFVTGLPGFQGMNSKLTIPFTNVTIAEPRGSSVSLAAPRVAYENGTFELTATLASNGPRAAGSGPPMGGSVRFLNGDVVLGEAPVLNGVARLPVELPRGQYALRAIYLGDATHTFSASREVELGVGSIVVRGATIEARTATGALRFRSAPLGPRFRGRFDIDTLDLGNDGVQDVVIAPLTGNAASNVIILNGANGRLFDAYGAGARGQTAPVNVEVADVNGDGRADVVSASGRRIVVFGGRHRRVFRSFQPFGARAVRGLNVALTDQNGDGRADIVATGRVGGRNVRATFDGRTGRRLNGG